MSTTFEIAVLPGDGIGPEIMPFCIDVINEAVRKTGAFSLNYKELPAGASAYQKTGEALPAETLKNAKKAHAVLFGAAGMPDIRYPDGTEIVPQIELREKLELYAGVRPVRNIPGAPTPLSDPRARNIDFVIVRESTEGLFAAREYHSIEDNRVARDTMVITRETSERLFEFAFKLTRKRKEKGSPGVLTCVDKANVLPSMAFFRKIFDECAQRHPDVQAEHAYVDATALNLVRQPWIFDGMVMENMYGDILSDLGAGLIGGMGMAPSGDVGDTYAVFQPCHGSAPDIAGTGKANPTAMILSAAMMLDWLAERYDCSPCETASKTIRLAVDRAFEKNSLVPYELGGNKGLADIAQCVLKEIQRQ